MPNLFKTLLLLTLTSLANPLVAQQTPQHTVEPLLVEWQVDSLIRPGLRWKYVHSKQLFNSFQNVYIWPLLSIFNIHFIYNLYLLGNLRTTTY